MERPKDYYRLLGVERTASAAAIKRAYRRLARQWQPDRSPGTSASTQDFQELQAAYETLADAERRHRYDETLRERERHDAPTWAYVRSPSSSDLRRPIQPSSLSGEILLSADEAACGGVLPLDVPVATSCPSCEGTGGYVFDCERCGGEGTIERRFPVPVRIPPGVREGTVFQVTVDDPSVLSVLLTIHIRGI
jgi:DnaJ-class molecular chaperone